MAQANRQTTTAQVIRLADYRRPSPPQPPKAPTPAAARRPRRQMMAEAVLGGVVADYADHPRRLAGDADLALRVFGRRAA